MSSRSPVEAVPDDRWLRSYYFTRAGVSAAWVAAAFTLGAASAPIAGTLLVVYPAWDALANLVDARHNGGFKANPSQAVNAAGSAIAAAAVAVALASGMNAVLAVFGAWAVVAGLFQLTTGIGRWRRHGAQWAMILSGAQSALAGSIFVKQAVGAAVPGIADLAPYAGFGAFYFLVSAVLLSIGRWRRSAQPV